MNIYQPLYVSYSPLDVQLQMNLNSVRSRWGKAQDDFYRTFSMYSFNLMQEQYDQRLTESVE